MDDRDGPTIAEGVYKELFASDFAVCEHVDRIPFALDAAVRELRESGAHWTRWATYVHVGI